MRPSVRALSGPDISSDVCESAYPPMALPAPIWLPSLRALPGPPLANGPIGPTGPTPLGAPGRASSPVKGIFSSGRMPVSDDAEEDAEEDDEERCAPHSLDCDAEVVSELAERRLLGSNDAASTIGPLGGRCRHGGGTAGCSGAMGGGSTIGTCPVGREPPCDDGLPSTKVGASPASAISALSSAAPNSPARWNRSAGCFAIARITTASIAAGTLGL